MIGSEKGIKMSGKIGTFSALAISCKIDLIDKLKLEIAASSPFGSSEFSDLLCAVFGKFVDLNPKKLSDELGFTHNIVSKWVARKIVPHPVIRSRAVTWIESSLNEKRNELEILLAT